MALDNQAVRRTLLNAAPVIVGLAGGIVIVATVDYRAADLWPVWATLGIALTGTAGLVFSYGRALWNDLPEDTRRFRAVALPATGSTVLVIVVVFAGALFDADEGWRGPALVIIAVTGAIPAACTILGVLHAARNERSGFATFGERTNRLLELGRLLRRRLLPAVGSLVALSTLALGAAIELQNSLPSNAASGEVTPPEIVLIFGGVGSLVVAVLYAPAASALNLQARNLCHQLINLDDAEDADGVLELGEKRRRLEQLLEVDRGVLADLQTGLIVLGPLIASAAGRLLPG